MAQRFSFESKVLAAFAAAVLVVAALAAATWKVSRDAVDAALLVSHTLKVLDTISSVRDEKGVRTLFQLFQSGPGKGS